MLGATTLLGTLKRGAAGERERQRSQRLRRAFLGGTVRFPTLPILILALEVSGCALPPNSPQDHPYRRMPEPASNYG